MKIFRNKIQKDAVTDIAMILLILIAISMLVIII
jgi:hypothetical protein